MPLKPHPGSLVAYAIVALVAGGFIALASVDGGRSGAFGHRPLSQARSRCSRSRRPRSRPCCRSLFGIGFWRLRWRAADFPAATSLLAILGTTMVMPSIVAVLAVLASMAATAGLQRACGHLGLDGEFSIFGYPGILIAHVLLNGPFVARIVLDGLSQVPAEQWRLASDLRLHALFRSSGISIGRSCARNSRHLASLVFLLCFKSFAIVLALGGGPSRATLEVAIYEALKIDLDFSRAAWLALIQLAICLSVTLSSELGLCAPARGRTRSHPPCRGPMRRAAD